MSIPEGAEPPVNIYLGNAELVVAIPVPGAHPEEVEAVVTPDRLRITAQCKYPQASQHYELREWQVGAWHRDLPLPHRVDPARAHATLNLGVLVVMAPLSEDGTGEARLSPAD